VKIAGCNDYNDYYVAIVELCCPLHPYNRCNQYKPELLLHFSTIVLRNDTIVLSWPNDSIQKLHFCHFSRLCSVFVRYNVYKY